MSKVPLHFVPLIRVVWDCSRRHVHGHAMLDRPERLCARASAISICAHILVCFKTTVLTCVSLACNTHSFDLRPACWDKFQVRMQCSTLSVCAADEIHACTRDSPRRLWSTYSVAHTTWPRLTQLCAHSMGQPGKRRKQTRNHT
jgi:hypothetical protein